MPLSDYVTTSITHTIRCDDCQANEVAHGGTLMQAIVAFKKKGWTETHSQILCPRHSREKENARSQNDIIAR